jgi:hypothetical protein
MFQDAANEFEPFVTALGKYFGDPGLQQDIINAFYETDQNTGQMYRKSEISPFTSGQSGIQEMMRNATFGIQPGTNGPNDPGMNPIYFEPGSQAQAGLQGNYYDASGTYKGNLSDELVEQLNKAHVNAYDPYLKAEYNPNEDSILQNAITSALRPVQRNQDMETAALRNSLATSGGMSGYGPAEQRAFQEYGHDIAQGDIASQMTNNRVNNWEANRMLAASKVSDDFWKQQQSQKDWLDKYLATIGEQRSLMKDTYQSEEDIRSLDQAYRTEARNAPFAMFDYIYPRLAGTGSLITSGQGGSTSTTPYWEPSFGEQAAGAGMGAAAIAQALKSMGVF